MTVKPKIERIARQKACRQCSEKIPIPARLCSHCNSYQDWRGYINVSSAVLALAVALLSVSTTLIPVLSHYIIYRDSDVSVGFPTFDGTIIRFVANNSGYAPASVEFVKLRSPLLETPVIVHPMNSGTLIPHGAVQLSYEAIPSLSEDQAYQQSLRAITHLISKNGKSADGEGGEVLVSVFQSDGTRRIDRFPVLYSQLFDFLRADSDRCNAIKEPNFVNGCIGTGEDEHDLTPSRPVPHPR